MRIIVTELKKLFSSKIFILIIFSVFVLNGYLMFRTANSGDAKSEQYKEVYTVLDEMSDYDKLKWLDERLTEFEGQHSYNWTVLSELRNECANIVGYSDYLDSIDAQAKSMTSVSIFANPDTFNYRSIVKTPPAYDNVRDVKLIFDISKGINLAIDNSFTDILCGFIVLYAVLSLMISDREQGMSELLFSLKRGRGYLLISKLLALAITIFSAVILIYGENLLISSGIFGLGNLSRPIQSLDGFIGCNLKISVMQYLMLYILFKFIAIFSIGTVLSLIAVNTKITVSFYGISAIILILEGVFYAVIHPLSIYSIFRYVNIIAFTKTNEIFCNFKNINFFEYPIPLIPTSMGAMAVIMLGSTALSAYLYAKKRNLEFKKIGFKFKTFSGNKVHSKLYYTLYKSLILQKGIIVIAVFVAVAGFMKETFIKKYDYVDAYYQYYTELLEGDITSETDDFIAAEAQRFDELNARAIELMESSDIYSTELHEIQKQLAPSSGLYFLKERYEQIKNISNVQIFYDTGYKRAFGAVGYDDDMKYALAAMLLCNFLISPLIANDNKYRMKSVINSTASGNKSYTKRNIFIATIYGLISALLWIIPYSVAIVQYYGYGGLMGSIRSITDFIDFPLDISVLQYILLIGILRIIAVIGCSLIMLWVSSKCKNITSAVLVNFAIFTLPIIIYLLDAKIMINIGFNAILSTTVIFNNLSVMQLIFPIVFITILMLEKIRKCQSLK